MKTRRNNIDNLSNKFGIAGFNSRANEVRIWFNNQPIARLKFPSSELVDVALALTNGESAETILNY